MINSLDLGCILFKLKIKEAQKPIDSFISCCAFKLLYVEGGHPPPHKSQDLFYYAIEMRISLIKEN